MFLVGFGGLALALLGVVAIAASDLMWALTEWRNGFSGVGSERSGRWEFGNRAGGVIAIAAGLALFFIALAG